MHNAHEFTVAHGSEHRCNGPLQVGQDPQMRAGRTARFDPFRERPFFEDAVVHKLFAGSEFPPTANAMGVLDVASACTLRPAGPGPCPIVL